MTTAPAPAEQRFLLDRVDWRAYESLLGAVADQHVFVTYDRGRVELMSPSWEHDTRAEAAGQLVRILAEEMGLPIKCGGSSTFRREDLERGLEPDKCFYIRNEAKVRGKRAIDLSTDPPPDLCIEVEVSRRILGREDIYAQLGIPELWRDDGRHVRVFELRAAERVYVPSDRSPTLPAVPLEQVDRLLRSNRATDDTTWSRTVREWARGFLEAPPAPDRSAAPDRKGRRGRGGSAARRGKL